MELETIIGLEIHAQLSTKSKLFSPSDNDAFEAKPNTRINAIDMGFPGMLPVLNKVALQKAARAAVALGCKIQNFSKFDRKSYFYPDLPNGFQVSQYDQPLALNGKVEFERDGKKHSVKITRVHLENDAGKLTHTKNATLCDYNRSGTPLIEIVTDPDLRSPEEAQSLAKEIQKILRFVDASNADMEKGMMRFDASISLRPKNEKKLYPRTEIKNLNSFVSLLKALKKEQSRQKELWKKNKPQENEITVGWLDDSEEIKIMRDKESANDYRYMPEPDIPPITFSDEDIADIEKNIPELPLAKYKRYRKDYKLNENDALKLSESIILSSFFEEAVAQSNDTKKSASLILSTVLADNNWQQTHITPEHIADIIALLDKGIISSSGAKEVIIAAMKNGKSAKTLLKELGLEQVSNTDDLEAWVNEVMQNNEQSVQDYKNGKEKALQYLMGQVMKLSKGAANPKMISEMLKKRL